jgi:peptidoglycan/xylan/chitin deacetylase (PgdA/CDA1 family)
MYHSVSLSKSEALTISVNKLEEQFAYLAEKGFKTYHFKELMGFAKLPSEKSIVITFDDAYVNQMELALPLLEKYDLKATFFVPLAYLGKTDEWNTATLDIMNAAQLNSLDSRIIELGYHSFYHNKYSELSKTEIEEDCRLCIESVSENKLPISAVLAYPYGNFPRKTSKKEEFIRQLKKHPIEFGTRIGNRLNRFPFRKPFEIQRIDVKGEFSLGKFKRKIKFGKLL